jgi:CDP-glucose 4,6-dehydratase
VVVTTDKCYENRETNHAYRETDPLGGHDPYSASKAAAEIAVSSWQRSFFADSDIRVATARAGNVIGGGDWTKYQLVPDCIRALQDNRTIDIRNPHATRPWQHVLEPLSGYLWLGATLSHPGLVGAVRNDIASAFNFGPFDEANVTVEKLVDELLAHWPGRWQNTGDPAALHEAGLLMISIAKAGKVLQWTPTWDLKRAVAHTARFYHQLHLGEASARELCLADLAAYENTARDSGQRWAQPRS